MVREILRGRVSVFETTPYNRVMPARKRFASTWILGLIVAAPIIYLLSIAPVCWWLSKPGSAGSVAFAPRWYWPIGRLVNDLQPEGKTYRLFRWYATCGGKITVVLPAGGNNGDRVSIYSDVYNDFVEARRQMNLMR